MIKKISKKKYEEYVYNLDYTHYVDYLSESEFPMQKLKNLFGKPNDVEEDSCGKTFYTWYFAEFNDQIPVRLFTIYDYKGERWCIGQSDDENIEKFKSWVINERIATLKFGGSLCT